MSHLKPLVDNLKLLNSFNDYVDILIGQQHKIMEQAGDSVTMYRAQGAITLLRRLKLLRDEVKANGK